MVDVESQAHTESAKALAAIGIVSKIGWTHLLLLSVINRRTVVLAATGPKAPIPPEAWVRRVAVPGGH